jgi:hypothetical protein
MSTITESPGRMNTVNAGVPRRAGQAKVGGIER